MKCPNSCEKALRQTCGYSETLRQAPRRVPTAADPLPAYKETLCDGAGDSGRASQRIPRLYRRCQKQNVPWPITHCQRPARTDQSVSFRRGWQRQRVTSERGETPAGRKLSGNPEGTRWSSWQRAGGEDQFLSTVADRCLSGKAKIRVTGCEQGTASPPNGRGGRHKPAPDCVYSFDV